jgi:hypothetical protein
MIINAPPSLFIVRGWTRMPGGVKALPLRVERYVAVYKKIEGSWWCVATIELFVT